MQLPKKRYFVMLGGLLYAVMLWYVHSTPTAADDAMLESVKNATMVIFAVDENGEQVDYSESV